MSSTPKGRRPSTSAYALWARLPRRVWARSALGNTPDVEMATPLATTHGGTLLGFILFALLAGVIVGAIARLLVPGPTPMGCLGTALAGIAGSFIAAIIGRLLFGPAYAPGFIASVLGAVLVVWLVSRRRGYY